MNACKGRVLVFSYAFPPMGTQMTPVITKPMAALSRLGYEVDVLCSEPFSQYVGRDSSLVPYTETHFREIWRLSPPKSLIGRAWLRIRMRLLAPDLMSLHRKKALKLLLSMDLSRYDGVITWSPFHSVNPVMVALKKHRPEVFWLAQFSDPWAGNPLERRWFARLWSRWHESRAVAAADFIVHSSSCTRDAMAHRYTTDVNNKSCVVAHPYDDALYPQRPKARNQRTTLRYIGALFGRRSPEPLFKALHKLLARRPELRDSLYVELVGEIPGKMLTTPSARALPTTMIRHVPSVSYLASLEKMYDADILLLIEADVRQNLFVPSKLSDYMGARTPIVGIAPPGGSLDVLEKLGCWHANPADIDGIAEAIEAAVDHVRASSDQSWCDEKYRTSFSAERIAQRFANILKGITPE
ncbi:MAG: glycosyltransferase family 4 protein [Thiobacillus sp.]|nr:glycosyltransferase family 4 protein [Thiobacillus sp.]